MQRTIPADPQRLDAAAAETNMADITARAFMDHKLARRLAQEPLAPPEVMIFLRHRETFENGRVLDLGVGSGRTTRYLAAFCADYLGIDLSPEMLAYARRAHSQVRFRQADLRGLADLREGEFDFILIAYNTIDVLDHEDRLTFLSEVRRCLTADGLFVFSTHNRSWRLCGQAPKFPSLESAAGLPRYLYNSARTVRAYLNHRKLAPLQRAEEEYAVVTGSYNRTGLVYCIDREAQVRQLRESGFAPVGIYDIEGRLLGDKDIAAESYNLHFVCKRIAS